MRVLICGSPRTGKTTLAKETFPGLPARHVDDLLIQGATRHDVVLQVGRWLDDPGPWVVEGCSAVLGLRRWLLCNAGTPADLVVHAWGPKVPRTPQQTQFARGLETVWAEVLPVLRRRGVKVVAAGRLAQMLQTGLDSPPEGA